MLKDKDKKVVSDIVTQYRPDLKKELLNKESFIYARIESYLQLNEIINFQFEDLERAWTDTNLENPIPDLTSEIDLLIEENFPTIKQDLTGLSIYTNVLIELAERKDILKVYDRYKYNTTDFVYTDQFKKELLTTTTAYLEEEGYL